MNKDQEIPEDRSLDVTWVNPAQETPLIYEGSFRESIHDFLLRMGFSEKETQRTRSLRRQRKGINHFSL